MPVTQFDNLLSLSYFLATVISSPSSYNTTFLQRLEGPFFEKVKEPREPVKFSIHIM